MNLHIWVLIYIIFTTSSIFFSLWLKKVLCNLFRVLPAFLFSPITIKAEKSTNELFIVTLRRMV